MNSRRRLNCDYNCRRQITAAHNEYLHADNTIRNAIQLHRKHVFSSAEKCRVRDTRRLANFGGYEQIA